MIILNILNSFVIHFSTFKNNFLQTKFLFYVKENDSVAFDFPLSPFSFFLNIYISAMITSYYSLIHNLFLSERSNILIFSLKISLKISQL